MKGCPVKAFKCTLKVNRKLLMDMLCNTDWAYVITIMCDSFQALPKVQPLRVRRIRASQVQEPPYHKSRQAASAHSRELL